MVKSSYTSIEWSRYWKKVRNTNRLIYIWQQTYLILIIYNISMYFYICLLYLFSLLPVCELWTQKYMKILFLFVTDSIDGLYEVLLQEKSLRAYVLFPLIWATSAGYCLTTTRQLDFFRETIFLLFFWSCSFTFCQKCMYSWLRLWPEPRDTPWM